MNAGLYEPAWSELLERRARRQNRTTLFILGFALFALSVMGDLDLPGVVILIGVILVHELGHLAAMWVFGYKDLGVFFIPMLYVVFQWLRERVARKPADLGGSPAPPEPEMERAAD